MIVIYICIYNLLYFPFYTYLTHYLNFVLDFIYLLFIYITHILHIILIFFRFDILCCKTVNCISDLYKLADFCNWLNIMYSTLWTKSKSFSLQIQFWIRIRIIVNYNCIILKNRSIYSAQYLCVFIYMYFLA